MILFAGCDTTSKIGTKTSALKTASRNDFSTLVSFGKTNLDDSMLDIAERFLVQCICKDESVTTFDQLRNKIYYRKSQLLDLEKLPPTSTSIMLHIKRAYLQTHVWLHSPFVASITIDPLDYGYQLDDEDHLKPIVTDNVLPDDLPQPCKCVKCAKPNVCICRVNGISCSRYCNCRSEACKNPLEQID